MPMSTALRLKGGSSRCWYPTMKITYRPLTVADHEFCVRVHHLSMRAYVEPIWGWNEVQQAELALEFLNHHDAIHEIAMVMGTPIGYLSYQNKAEILFINKLHLHPDYQGHGHGTHIMLRLIWLVQPNRKPIELSVLTTNTRARTFYERQGFIVVEETVQKVRLRRLG
jgi:ribosomal protein S18 acetylase RimI-like enzyme